MSETGHRKSLRFLETKGNRGITLVQGERISHAFPRHTHKTYCIGLIHHGSRLVTLEKDQAAISENQLFVINPDTPHACRTIGPFHSYSVICARKEVMADLSAQIAGAGASIPFFPSCLIRDSDLVLTFQRVIAQNDLTQPGIETDEALMSLLSKLAMRHSQNPPDPLKQDPRRAVINRAMDYILTHLRHDHSLKDLANIAGLSPFHFHRRFLELAGVSPHDFLIQSRIKKARHLIESGTSLAEAAYETGFSDQSHMTRMFKRHTGVTPGVYKKSNM